MKIIILKQDNTEIIIYENVLVNFRKKTRLLNKSENK